MDSYVMYHCHTEDSLLDSCDKYSTYIDLAVRDGMKAISFSEHGKPLNWTEKWGACKAAGIKYIHSVEIYLTETLDEKIRDNYHTVLMARNMAGVLELNKLISMSCDKEHFYYKNRISFDEFLSISDNIISTSACLASPLWKLPTDHPRYMELARKYDFLEVQGHNLEDQKQFNKRLYKLSKEIGTPLIAGTDTHSSSRYKAECRRVIISTKGKIYPDEELMDLTYKTLPELIDLFRKQGALPEKVFMEAIENTNKLYDMVEDIELDNSIKYPILYGTREADSQKFDEVLAEQLEKKLKEGIIPPEEEEGFRKSIEEEVRVFKKLKMEGFMLSMSELITWCRDHDLAIGPGRGSVGGSRSAFVSNITEVDPEKWHTVFSRFCNEDREEIGDIDIDCVDSDRPAIFNYITERFGSDKTARVAAFGTLQERAAIDLIGKYLCQTWNMDHGFKSDEKPTPAKNPWSLGTISNIKDSYEKSPEKAKKKYKELFYFLDGLVGTKVSQSVHPAGMVISPITLDDNYGTFDKDGEKCLFLDMDNVHDYTGLAKYDFLSLKTVQVIRDTCNYIGIPYPKMSEIDWDDKDVWASIIKDPVGIFQFEGAFAFECLKKFEPQSIFDMSIVTACIRPSGTSYRDDLLRKIPHHNPSEIIDDLLKDNLGYLIYQEDTIKFLQQICGLSGSEADNIRRAIGRKQRDRLEKAMPDILEGYCNKSDKPREVAEEEAKQFLQIIEDSANYQFGYNHSIAYCMVGYLCAYYRHYYPVQFITSFLNNAANNDDIRNGTVYAEKVGIKILPPRWGFSKGEYFFNEEKQIIAKGISSIKFMSEKLADELYEVANRDIKFESFTDVLNVITRETSINTRQLDILIKIDFFAEFGNQRELMYISDMFYDLFKKGEASRVSRERIAGTEIEPIVSMYSTGLTKSGAVSKYYTIDDMRAILLDVEKLVKSKHMEDLSIVSKAKNFEEVAGYLGYTSGREEDKRKLLIMGVYEVYRKRDGAMFGHSIITKSIGTGVESRMTVFNRLYDKNPIKEGDIIYCKGFTSNGPYFTLTAYDIIKD